MWLYVGLLFIFCLWTLAKGWHFRSQRNDHRELIQGHKDIKDSIDKLTDEIRKDREDRNQSK